MSNKQEVGPVPRSHFSQLANSQILDLVVVCWVFLLSLILFISLRVQFCRFLVAWKSNNAHAQHSKMRFPNGYRIITSVLALLSLDISASLVAADAPFLDVRTSLQRDRSGRRGDPKDKYFHESTFDPHYDGRFADHEVGKGERLPHLRALMQTFLSTMSDIGAETWIM